MLLQKSSKKKTEKENASDKHIHSQPVALKEIWLIFRALLIDIVAIWVSSEFFHIGH